MRKDLEASFVVRSYEEADFEGALGVIHACSRANHAPFFPSAEEFRARLGTPGDFMPEDALVAEWRGTRVVAYADGALEGETGERQYVTSGYVHPSFQRRGIGRAILDRQVQRARRTRGQAGDRHVTLVASAYESQVGAQALFCEAGMARVRYFLGMSRDLSVPLPVLDLPRSLMMKTWAERRDDRALWSAREEAFADHWGQSPTPFAEFAHRVASGAFSPESSFVAWDGDDIVGGSVNRMGPGAAAIRGKDEGWIRALFVRRAWRGRGLGRALLVASMHRARELGHAAVGLNVDAESLTGALRLYESVGFVITTRRAVYHLVCESGQA
jgi:mycothiol synthase